MLALLCSVIARPVPAVSSHPGLSVTVLSCSSPSDIAAGARVSLQRAEETYRYLRYGFDTQMLPESLCAKGKSNTATRS